MPPAECHSPMVENPSPAADPPPPGRAWNMCQMKRRPLRGSVPFSAMRRRRPQPPIARSGQAGASATMIASMISLEQWLVHMVTGAPSRAQTMVPSFNTTCSGRNAPSFLVMSGSSRKAKAIATADCVLAKEELMKPVTCGSESGQVHRDVAALLGDAGADDDVGAVEAVVVQHRLAVIDAVGPGRDDGAGVTFGGVEHCLHRVAQRGRAELGDHRGQALLAELGRADLRREVAAEVARMAHVQRQHLQQVLAQHAVFGQAHRRDAQALVPDFRGGGVVGAVRGAADVGVVRAHHRPEHQRVAGEHRHEGGEVGQVRTAAIRVVQQVDVARRRVGKALGQRLRRPGHGADMHRDMVGLRHQAAARVDQRDGEVARGVEDLRIGGAQHRLAHFLGDGVQPVLQHRDGDRIGHAADGGRLGDIGKCAPERGEGRATPASVMPAPGTPPARD